MTPPSVDPSRVHRTPSERFDNVPSFPYQPRYGHFGNLRYAYIDETGPIIDVTTGKPAGENVQSRIQTETVLCLHGEPTWSYLYRKMIPGFLHDVSARPGQEKTARYIRRRVVVPDFIGFGRSDKPIDDDYYTWDSHRSWLVNFVVKHIIEDPRTAERGRVTLVVQDWGGLLGLLLPSLFPATFTHLIVMNTGLGIGRMPSKGWVAFRDFMARSPDVDIGALIARGTPLSEEEVNAYRAPFPDEQSKAGARRFPQLVPVNPHMRGVSDSIAALSFFQSLPPIAYTSNSLDKPSTPQSQGSDIQAPGVPLQVFIAVGKADPVLGEPVMQSLAKNAWSKSTGYWWHVIDDGGHFVQEWAAHLPRLTDEAWSRPQNGVVNIESHKAEWTPPSRPASIAKESKM